MPLSTFIKDLSETERKLKIEGQCVRKFTLKQDGSVDQSGSGDGLVRVLQDRVTGLKGFKLLKNVDRAEPDHEEDRKQYWTEVRDYLKQEQWVQESEKLPIVASARTFVAIMLLPFQSVPKIHVWKEDGVIFMMKSVSKDVNGLKHAKNSEKEINQKANLIQHLRTDDDKNQDRAYKISKLTIGSDNLVCISDIEAYDENDNEIKVSIRKVFADEKKKDKYYRYAYPRLVTTAAIRQIRSVLLVTKNEEDCVEETMWLSKLKGMFEELKKSPSKSNWSLQKSIAFLNRFLCLVYETLDWMDERKVASFSRSETKKEIAVQVEDFECDELTGN